MSVAQGSIAYLCIERCSTLFILLSRQLSRVTKMFQWPNHLPSQGTTLQTIRAAAGIIYRAAILMKLDESGERTPNGIETALGQCEPSERGESGRQTKCRMCPTACIRSPEEATRFPCGEAHTRGRKFELSGYYYRRQSTRHGVSRSAGKFFASRTASIHP